jgi:TolB-like protein/thioredoxin-like negative regulator of GroEL
LPSATRNPAGRRAAGVAGAWGFLQGLEYASETFDWPTQIRQVALLTLLIGLPVVLVLAWYHGDRGEQRIRGTELVIITLLFLAGGGIFWLYDRAGETPDAASDTAAPSPISPIAPAAAHAKSIAVLPFADMSAEKDQEYMADGMAEELLNLLAKVPDLKVIARTSSFAFKGEKVGVAEIAKRLNVAHVLEGSVRTAGNGIRVTAQLIRATDSVHLWSETYDRPLDNIFEVQDQIAGAIAQALQIKLSGGNLSRRDGGTQNLEAYQLYLRALKGINESSKASVDAAEGYLKQAVKIDPNFGAAWSLLGDANMIKAEMGLMNLREGNERARQLQLHALELSPNLADAHAALAFIHLGFDWDWMAAEAEIKRALELDPTSVNARNAAGRLYTALGRVDHAERQLRTALDRDPLDPYLKINLGLLYYLARSFPEAETTYRQLLNQAPAFIWTRSYLGKTLLGRGDPQAALAMVRQEPDEPIRLLYLPIVLEAAGLRNEAEEALKDQIAEWAETGPYFVAQTYAYRGDHNRALEWLERAYDTRDVGLVEMYGEPLLDDIADDPRFKAFLRKMKLPEWPNQSTAVAGT